MPSAMALERGDAYNQGSELVIQMVPYRWIEHRTSRLLATTVSPALTLLIILQWCYFYTM